MNLHKTRLLLLLFVLPIAITYGQDTISVAVRTNILTDKIQLRWAVSTPSAWYYTNKHGITIERYTLMRGDGTLDIPEKVVLTPTPLKPHPLDDWQQIAQSDNYAAIIAQSLYGDDFEVSGGKKDIGQIIALSQEQEQRFAMSMFAAEMSFPAALFAGWGYEDTTVKPGERYLYRIVPVSPDETKHIETGSAYVGLDDYQPLPRPLDLSAMWGNGNVMVTWNSRLLERYYSSYYIERSEDGKKFRRLTDVPLINMMDGDRMFYNDSIANNKTYYYRVVGLTAFSQEGPLSDTIQGQGSPKLIYNPNIIKAMPDDEGKVEVSWFFDEHGNDLLQSFELRRSDTDKGPFTPIVSGIKPNERTAIYEKPLPENYLVIAAIPKDGEETVSFPFLLQMEDSIPPAIPVGLEGYVDTTGVVHLKWTANTEPDLLGYRIYRGQTEGEELIPLTDIAVKANEYQDSIHIHNLNQKVYYAITALDRRYNQSELSETLILDKPDVIPPSPPFISKIEARDEGVYLEWIPGKEQLRSYIISRSDKTTGYREMIMTIINLDSTSYLDASAVGNTNYEYDVVAVSNSFLESAPSPTAAVKAKAKNTGMSIKSLKASRTDKGILLKWEHTVPDVKMVSIYRKEGGSPLSLWKTLEIWEREVLDNTAKRNTTYEYLLVIKNQNGKPVNAQTKIN
ncbi:fibronectin type III domain-containing protein [Dysgonomonas sp. 511]|uniref:fibronectin type III domain-containing protein n=1 Tax=Dysgonomonas sp. 511 TaxID=2302930 RepID=UPI0013D7441D|nr:hypothetical protein [Dysgonomonas sp. 511]NDV79489.1 hypothetical protein [Dysgonomonas sp. 511]